jgi:hypothetical protein
MKYYLLSNSIVISVGDKTHVISNDDYRYQRIKQHLLDKNFAPVEKLINPTHNLNKDGFVVDNGLVYYQGSPIPSVLGNRFMEYQQSSWEFKSIFNFWFNLKTRISNEDASDIIHTLIEKKAYAVTEDGFYFVYCDPTADQTKSILNKKKLQEIFHFYNYATCPNVYREIFENKKNIDELIQQTFGFNSKKLRKLALDNLFNGKDNFINYRFMFYGEAFKDVLAHDNVFTVIENEMMPVNGGDIEAYQKLNTFLKDYSIEKNGKYSQKKVLNFLESAAANKQHIVDCGIYYCQLKEVINFDIQAIEFPNNCAEIHAYLLAEFEKIKDPILPLNNDPEVEALHEVEFDSFRIIVPKTNHELKEWSNLMQNCIGGYSDKVRSKGCRLLAVMDRTTNQMLYNIEIVRKSVSQLLTRGNNSPKYKDHETIIKGFLKEKGLIFKE